jgi:putative polyketide hydroxylase
MQIKEQVPVLIIGGGIAGLSAALFLLKHSIKPVVIEKHKGVSVHPRSRGFDVRTMELYRELGLSQTIRNAGEASAPAWGIHTDKSLAAYLQKAKPKVNVKSPIQLKGLESLVALTPEAGARCTQDIAEPILLAAAKESGAEILFNTEMLSFSQDETKVTVTVRDRETGDERVIQASYMIAADGAKSSIRETLGITTTGKGALGNLLNIYFKADVSGYIQGKEFSLLRIDEPDMKGLLASINNTDRWVFHLHYDPAKEHVADMTNEMLVSKLQQVIGLPGVEISIITVLPWQPTVKVVTEMQHGRIFFAGDSAHVMTPYGGKGASSGVQDAHNLAWKLAYVIQGKASPELLKTYSVERQPVGLHYAMASGNMADQYGLIKKVIFKFYWAFMSVMVLSFLRLQKLFPQIPMLQLGELLGLPEYHYYSKAVIQDEHKNGYIKSGRLMAKPGTRFPHLWLDQEHKISTLDLLGKEFVLFAAEDHTEWKKAASVAGISFYSLQSISSSVILKKDEVVLVRPDGFVAWRNNKLPAAPAEVLKQMIRSLLQCTITT